MKRFLFLLLGILPAPLFASDVIDQAMRSVVAIFPADPDAPAGGGSGVVISPDGYAITNFHVVQPCGPAMKCAMADGKLYDTVVVGLDPVGDIALIKLLGRTAPQSAFPYAPFADSNAVNIGDIALVMGNPFLLATDFQPCVSKGIISGTHRYQFPAGTFLEYTDCLQTDAAINPGNSGGPLFNDQGEIIGIVGRCSFEKRGRVNVGIGYAVSSNQVQYFLGDLKSGRIVDHATLNAVVSTDQDGRVVFDDVLETSDAFRSGLRYNDELLRFAGQVVDSANTFKNLLGIFPKHWRLPITIRGKEGTRQDIQVRLAGLHGENELVEMTEKMIAPPIQQEEDGIDIEPAKKEPYISESVKPFYEKRIGYANYYFNRLETERVLRCLRSNSPSTWTLTGKLQDREDAFSFQIEDKGVRYTLPTGSGYWNVDLMLETEEFIVDPMTHYQSPHGSGGLFTALYLFRSLTLNKPLPDAEIVYTGTAPIGGNLAELYDVCTVIWRGNEIRFYVDSETGEVPLIEMAASGLDFPCEINFTQNAMNVRYGRILFGIFERETTDAIQQNNAESSEEAGENNARKPVKTPLIAALQKIVKIYGAESGGTHGYQSGVLISSDGYILTALTSALQTDSIAAVLDSGRKFEARLVAAEPVMEIALLKIVASNLLYFDINQTAPQNVPLGMPIYALSNPFNISQGNERATVQRGSIAAKTMLSARRGVFETPYKGSVFVLDITTNNPGVCGGALISEATGELLGILGKELRNNANHTWLNFAIPTFVWQNTVQSMIRGGGTVGLFSEKSVREHEMIPEDTIRIFQHWGILLVPSISRRTPPFIESVRNGSEAHRLGLLPDDLIVMVNNQLTPSLSAVELCIQQVPPEQPITLTIERGSTLRDVVFTK